MNRVLKTLLFLSCFCASISALRLRLYRPAVKKGCRNKNINCPSYARHNYCTSSNHKRWMTINCALSCGHCAKVAGTTPPPDPNPPFQIYSSAYDKCLTVRVRRVVRRYSYTRRMNGKHTYRYNTKTKAKLSLRSCIRYSAGQSWRWTSRGQLQSSLNQQCLAVTRVSKAYQGFQYEVAMQTCNSNTSEQEWICTGGYLKLKNLNLYLVPWLYSYIGGVQVHSTVTNSCLWTRYGTSKSLCENATQPTPTTQMITRTPQGQWFPIQSTHNKKCLALRDTSKLSPRLRWFAPPFTLTTCNQFSAKQLWQRTKYGQLKLKHNGNCLTVDTYRKVHLRSCTASNQNQRWTCLGNKLKIGRKFLASFMYSGFPFGYSVSIFLSCRYNCDWSRFGSASPVCDTGKSKTTVRPTSASITTTPIPTTPTTNPHTTTPTPPVPSTGGLKTPLVPPTGDLKTPPLPPTFDLKTPPIPPTGDLKPPPPFPGNTPATPPVITTTRPPPPQGNKKIKCGTKGRTGGIVNGTAAAAGSWPWQVGIKTCAHCNITCGGALINDEWVVTAAHCVSGWFPNELHIVIGEVDQSKKSGHEQRFGCTTIIMHEDYAIGAPYDKDIALIRLNKHAVFNDHVRPLCMPDKSTVLTDKDLCTVTGFGRVTQNGAKSAQLLQANVKIVALKTCAQAYQNLPKPRKVTSNMLCAGYKRGGTDACQGDSGGPLTCFDRKNFRFILGGVVSWGVGCAQAGQYGVYTNTALFTPWVEKKLIAYGYQT